MRRLLLVLLALMVTACTPLMVQQSGVPPAAFSGPRLEGDRFISFDGTRLGLTTWQADEPWAVIIGVHGMNDYANAFHLAAPWWASQGVTTYAYDQRGFGRSPNWGVWGGDELMVEDLRTMAAVVRARHPKAILVVAGESMGGSVAVQAFASDRPPAADRLVLLSPGVWGWSSQPLPYKTTLWFAARLNGAKVYRPPNWLTKRVAPTDNREELMAMGRDPLMVWGARSDALYGLVAMMERAWRETGLIKVPALYLYGAHDEIIPKRPAFEAASRLKPGDRTAYYAQGWHLMTRDRQGPKVWADILSYVRSPDQPLPSNPPPIPRPAGKSKPVRSSAASSGVP